ncbi:MAG TPA: hypothetical protein VND89_02420 [Acidimicrobiales bacterium]|nr:hypothetical protein [Acidimicrobiales bacterium]
MTGREFQGAIDGRYASAAVPAVVAVTIAEASASTGGAWSGLLD